MSHRLLITALLICLLGAAAASPAAAAPPEGNWTFIRDDGYRHYACKVRENIVDPWRIRTATWWDGERARRLGIPVYAAIVRRSNENVVSSRDSDNWERGWVRMSLRGAFPNDRLWMQLAAYGPPPMWRKGVPVRRITRCA